MKVYDATTCAKKMQQLRASRFSLRKSSMPTSEELRPGPPGNLKRRSFFKQPIRMKKSPGIEQLQKKSQITES